MNKIIFPLIAILLFAVIATSGCDVKSTGQQTYIGIITSISYDGGNKITKLTINATSNNTTLFIEGLLNGIEIGSKYKIVIENQKEGEKAIPAKLISIKKLTG